MLIIETDRLVLEQATLADAPFFLELLNSPGWLQYIGDRGVHTIEDAEAYIQKSLLQSYADNGFGLYKTSLKTVQVPIGICGIIKRPMLDQPDIGFAMLSAYAKQGYAYEAAHATMDYARSALGLDTILAITIEENHNSRRLLEKIGLQLQGKKRYEGSEEEVLIYST